MKTLTIGIILFIGTVFYIFVERKRMQKYWSRSCTGAKWLRCFPQCSKDKIREFLDDFVDSFGFKEKNRLKFSPDDKIMDIYGAKYPPSVMGVDALELESFVTTLEEKYGLTLSEMNFPTITLGELFKMVTRKSSGF